MQNRYRTRQRALVLSYLMDSGNCHTAEEIIRDLGQRGEAVSKATVYRALELLVKSGDVSMFYSSRGESALYRYIGGHSDHFHLKCTKCGKTVCADCAFIDSMQKHFARHHGFTVSRERTVIYGICSDCSGIAENTRSI